MKQDWCRRRDKMPVHVIRQSALPAGHSSSCEQCSATQSMGRWVAGSMKPQKLFLTFLTRRFFFFSFLFVSFLLLNNLLLLLLLVFRFVSFHWISPELCNYGHSFMARIQELPAKQSLCFIIDEKKRKRKRKREGEKKKTNRAELFVWLPHQQIKFFDQLRF